MDAIESVELRPDAELVYFRPGFGCSYPSRCWGVRLPSGLIHEFDSAAAACRSHYWPYADVSVAAEQWAADWAVHPIRVRLGD